MIDFLATLDPATGLAAARELRPPTPADPLWQGLVQLTPHPDGPAVGERMLSAEVVGACGVSRSDVLVRAAGEAVERYALRPGATPGRPALASELAGAVLDFGHPEIALGDPAAATRPHTWYRGRRLLTDRPVWVPAPLVDHPCPADGFDPSPSGAAAGDSPRMALRSALLELIERDAVSVAWLRQLALPRIDLDRALAAAPATAHWRRLRTALDGARAAGLEPVLARIPTGVPGVVCAVGIVFDEQDGRPLAAVGCNAATDPGRGLSGALQEALQIRAVLRLVQHRHGAEPAPATVTEDQDRARYFVSAEGAAAVRAWVAGFTPAGFTPADFNPAGFTPADFNPAAPTAAGPDVEQLLDALSAQGADPVAVELTHRLPPRVAAMGWHAVKVIPVGLQPLRTDERCDYNRHRARLASAEARTGLRAHAGPSATVTPHPLI